MKINRSYIIDILLLLFVSVFFSFYHLEQLYGFEFDQERDFNIVRSMVTDNKFTLIGPRVVSSAGFYLGPWYYYLQVPFFVALSGNPIYGAYFAGFVSVSISLLTYFVLRRQTGSRLVPFFAALLWVSSALRSNWNVAFVPLFFLLFLHFYWQLAKGRRFVTLWLLTLTLAFAFNFHPQMVFLLPVWLFALYRYFRRPKAVTARRIILLAIALAIPFSPLVIFDLRHNFVNFSAALNFLTASSAKNAAIPFVRFAYSLRQFSTSLAYIYPGFQHNLVLTGLLLLFSLAACLKFRHYFFLIFIVLLSIVVLGFYREPTWPEYYHSLSSFALFVFLTVIAAKILPVRWAFYLLTLYMLWNNFHFLTSYISPGSYYYKKALVLYMLSENAPYPKLNIINDFRFGEGLGFQPIREFYEKPTGGYPPRLRFYVSYSDSPKHNATKKDFGLYAVSRLEN